MRTRTSVRVHPREPIPMSAKGSSDGLMSTNGPGHRHITAPAIAATIQIPGFPYRMSAGVLGQRAMNPSIGQVQGAGRRAISTPTMVVSGIAHHRMAGSIVNGTSSQSTIGG